MKHIPGMREGCVQKSQWKKKCSEEFKGTTRTRDKAPP